MSCAPNIGPAGNPVHPVWLAGLAVESYLDGQPFGCQLPAIQLHSTSIPHPSDHPTIPSSNPLQPRPDQTDGRWASSSFSLPQTPHPLLPLYTPSLSFSVSPETRKGHFTIQFFFLLFFPSSSLFPILFTPPCPSHHPRLVPSFALVNSVTTTRYPLRRCSSPSNTRAAHVLNSGCPLLRPRTDSSSS